MSLPRARVHNPTRIQPIDLQPYGNTISIEADSDNPFEDDRDVEIFTQASGGMAGPDDRQRSKKVLTKPANVRGHIRGQARSFKTVESAHRQGFMPGFGGFGDSQSSIDQDEANPPGFVPASGPAPTATIPGTNVPSSGGPSFLQTLTQAITGGANVANTALSTRQTKAATDLINAQTTQAMALRNQQQAARGGASSMAKYLPVAIGVVGAIAIGAMLLKGRKAAPATNPRRRR